MYITECGSGMGAIHSGEVANRVFYNVIESQSILDEEWSKPYKIRAYGRYRDDLIFFMDRRAIGHFSKLFQTYCTNHGYTVTVDQRGPTANYLDTHIYKDENYEISRRFSYTLYKKATNQRTYLHYSSGHAVHTHINWPLGEIRRIKARCMHKKDYEKGKREFIAALQSTFAPTHIIKKAQLFEPMAKEIRAVFSQMDESQIEMEPEEKQICKIRWVLPFHPTIARLPIARITNQIAEKWLGTNLKVDICWKNQYENLSTMVRKIIR